MGLPFRLALTGCATLALSAALHGEHVSPLVVGAGPALDAPWSICRSEAGLVVSDPQGGGVYGIEEGTGSRTLLVHRHPWVPEGIAGSGDGGVYIADRATGDLWKWRPSGQVDLLSRPGSRGEGPGLREPRALAVLPGGEIAVLEDPPGAASVSAVDPKTGRRRLLSGPGRGRGPELRQPAHLLVNRAGHLLVSDSRGSILEIAPESGDRKIRFDLRSGPDPLVVSPGGMVLGQRELLVADTTLGRVMAVDLATGARRISFSTDLAGGPPVADLEDLAPLSDGRLAATLPRSGTVLALGPDSERRVLSSTIPPDGEAGPVPAALLFEPGGRLLLFDWAQGDLVSVEPGSVARRLVSGSKRGGGPGFRLPTAMALAGSDLYVLDSVQGLFRVDLATGDRALAAPLPGTLHLAAAPEGALYVVDEEGGRLDRLDPRTGERTPVSGPERGAGPDLLRPRHAAVGPTGEILLVDQGGRVLAVTPETGDRRVVSGPEVGSGPELVDPLLLALEPQGHLVVVERDGRVLTVEPDGTRSQLSDEDDDPELAGATDAALGPDGRLYVALPGRRGVGILELASGHRSRLPLKP